MTRVNIGILPRELCDQHLITEYRELPRVFNCKYRSKPPDQFKLGKGHMVWCAYRLGHMYDKYLSIVEEMRYRGITVNYPEPPHRQLESWCDRPVTSEDILIGRELLIERINERLDEMVRVPVWTGRELPDWVQVY